MTDNKAAIQMALDALERAAVAAASEWSEQKDWDALQAARLVVNAAIAQPEQPAAEALVAAARKVMDEFGTSSDGLQDLYQALKAYVVPQPIAQPEQNATEPVAWRVRRLDAPSYWIIFLHYPIDAMNDTKREVQPLYIAQPEQTAEPDDLTIAYMSGFSDGKKAAQPVQPPPVRQPLTDDELSEIMEKVNFTYNPTLFARAIEAAYGIAQPEQTATLPMEAEELAELYRLRESVKAPESTGFATWQDLAVSLKRQLKVAQPEQTSPRGTDAQILKEREITTSAIVGTMAYGFQNGEYPPDDSVWLRPFWEMGRRDAEREALSAQQEQTSPAPGYCKNCKDYTIEEPMVAQPVQPVNQADLDHIFGTIYEAQRDKAIAICEALGRSLAQSVAQPEQTAPVRQPLTDRQTYELIAATVGQPEPFEEIVSDGPEWAEFMAMVRVIEAAHGIKAIAQQEQTNPAPGYCKNCRDYTIKEPIVAQPEQNADANKTLSTLIYRIKNLNDNRLLQWELTDAFTEYQAAVSQPKDKP